MSSVVSTSSGRDPIVWTRLLAQKWLLYPLTWTVMMDKRMGSQLPRVESSDWAWCVQRCNRLHLLVAWASTSSVVLSSPSHWNPVHVPLSEGLCRLNSRLRSVPPLGVSWIDSPRISCRRFRSLLFKALLPAWLKNFPLFPFLISCCSSRVGGWSPPLEFSCRLCSGRRSQRAFRIV